MKLQFINLWIEFHRRVYKYQNGDHNILVNL